MRRSRLLALAALAALAACTAAPAPSPRPEPAAEPVRSARRQTVAVLPFADAGAGVHERLAFLRDWLPDTIAASLQTAGELRVVERRELLKILEEQKLGSSALASSEGRIALGKIAGAQTVIVGTFAAVGEALQLNARIVDVESGAILKTASATGEAAAARALGADLARSLGSGLGVSIERAARATGIADDRAMAEAELFYRGLAQERDGRRDEAIESFRKALDLDSADREAREHLKKLLGASD